MSDFLGNTLSSSIGSFVGVVGAYTIARWQLNKSQRDNNTLYYIRFNEAQIYINQFEEEIENILFFTLGKERKIARKVLTDNDFINLKQNLELTVKVMNPELENEEITNFIILLNQINQTAPLSLYKEMNDLFFWMAIIYNNLRKDCENLIDDELPESLDLGYSNEISINLALKRFRKKYKKMKRKLKI
ncbi:hypothetical protein COE51_21360 [Bacillus pseudomycoides]|nr:hypothetical protein COE51_21360 [Bacillus pseudomycoides]